MKFALIGCGKIAHKHARVLGDKINVAWDLNSRREQCFQEQYGIPKRRSLKADAFVVLTPPSDHVRAITNHVEMFDHPIICEKPLALGVSEAEKAVQACEKAGVRLFVVNQNRFNVKVQQVKARMERIGKPITASARLRWHRSPEYYQEPWKGSSDRGGGVLANQAAHHIDMLRWLIGPVQSVFCYTTTAKHRISAEDTAVAILRHKNGCLSTLEATTAFPRDSFGREGPLEIVAEHETVHIGGYAMNEGNPQGDPDYAHRAFYEHVTHCIETGEESHCCGSDALESVRLTEALYQSAKKGQEIKL